MATARVGTGSAVTVPGTGRRSPAAYTQCTGCALGLEPFSSRKSLLVPTTAAAHVGDCVAHCSHFVRR